MSTFSKGSALVVLVALASLVAAVSALAGARSTAATTDAVTAGKPAELKFTVAKKTVPKGLVTFKVTNKGKISHDFKIAGKKTAMIGPGKTVSLKITFKKAGKYAYLCTVPGHAPAGMKGTLTVK